MPGQDREAQSPDAQQDALELNKETLGDLDVEAKDTDDVKGGALPTTIICVSTSKAIDADRIR